jgi:hypothetical protein
MKDSFINLIKVNSLITLMIAAGLLYGFITGRIAGDQFMQISLMVFTFYFPGYSRIRCARPGQKSNYIVN